MTTTSSLYRDLASATRKIDRRNTAYRFDIDADIPWSRATQRGLHFGPRMLALLGIDLTAVDPRAAKVFDWGYAIAVCEAFHDLEEMVVRFTELEEGELGPSRSVELLCEEERKHMELFSHYAEVLKATQPDLAALWAAIPRPVRNLPGYGKDAAAFPDRASQHYLFWINTIFFEEFTILIADCLAREEALIQPLWAALHAYHKREEQQHLPTGSVHLQALALPEPRRSFLSKVFMTRLEQDFDADFGLSRACELVALAYPDQHLRPRASLRDRPVFRELAVSDVFRRSRAASPYLAIRAGDMGMAAHAKRDGGAALLGQPPAAVPASKLFDILEASAVHSPDIPIVSVAAGGEVVETLAQLRALSLRVAGSLMTEGMAPGDLAMIVADTPHDFAVAFWGCMAAGVIAVPASQSPRRKGGGADGNLQRLHLHLGAPPVLAGASLSSGAIPGARLLRVADLEHGTHAGIFPLVESHAPALLQFSSGSTGIPRGVVLSHANVIANASAVTRHLGVTKDDVTVSWMPLHHDMGLCLHLASVFGAIPQTLIATPYFARRPSVWFETVSACRATITGSPDFGLAVGERCLRKARAGQFDLSSLRCLLDGAEPLSARRAETFLAEGKRFGLRADVIVPCYGLAEATAAVTMALPGGSFTVTRWRRSSLTEGQCASPAPEFASDATPLVALGIAVPGVEVRIAAGIDAVAPSEFVGEIEIRGGSVAAGYWDDGPASAAAVDGGWLRTGDLGFVSGGQLYVAGRIKDVIVANGRKFHAADIEEALRSVPGAEECRLAVVASLGAHGEQRIAVFAEPRGQAALRERELAALLSSELARIIGIGGQRVIVLKPGELPLTASGKLRRHELRAALEAGDHDEPQRSSVVHTEKRAETSDGLTVIAALWADILGLPSGTVGYDDDFFAVGGDSLKAIELHGALEDRWKNLINPASMFEMRTVREQARFLGDLPGNARLQSEPEDLMAAPELEADVDDRGIAVVAMAGRFPGANSLEEFWSMLHAGRDSFRAPPEERCDSTRHEEGCPRIGTFLDAIGEFDAAAFCLTEAAAREIDPQQRLFLETVFDLVDQVSPGTRHIGVFAGAAENEYFSRQALKPDLITPLSAHSNLANMLSARIAQQMRLTGPAIGLDAACATSLAAVHYACRSLLAGECDAAIAGGVQLNLSDVSFLMFSRAGVLSPRGRCTPFAQGADGFVAGEGVGAVLLKPLAAALRDGDPILGIIRGSAMNNDGGAMSDMAPNPIGQAAVIRAALANAATAPSAIDLIEGHGAGTPIGDLVETRALAEVFAECASGKIAIGSVKGNVGHLFHAAGIASLIKVLLSLQHGEISPLAGNVIPEPRLRLAGTPLYCVPSAKPWPRGKRRRMAGISAFGVGGTNCHVIVEESPPLRRDEAERPLHLLLLSAPGEEDLQRVSGRFVQELGRLEDRDVAAFCAAANPRANRFRTRRAIVAASRQEMLVGLRALAQPRASIGAPQPVFLLPGPSGLHPGMLDHMLSEPAFSDALTACDSILRPWLGRPLAFLMGAEDELSRIAVAQPVSCAISLALAAWLRGLGIRPAAVIGHSGGEYAAAALAGVMSEVDALRLSAQRGRAMADCPSGCMAAIAAGEETVARLIEGFHEIYLACVNGPEQCVIAGPAKQLPNVLAGLESQGIESEIIGLDCAAHSELMRHATTALSAALANVKFSPPVVPFFSCVSGERLSSAGSDYWLTHLLAPVRFDRAATAALEAGFSQFIDLGPSATLARLMIEIVAGCTTPDRRTVALPLFRKSQPGWGPTLSALGRLFEEGADLDMRQLDGRFRGGLRLAGYPYDRRTLWIDPPAIALPAVPTQTRDSVPVERVLSLRGVSWVADHRIFGEASAPSALMLGIVLSQDTSLPWACEDVVIERPLRLSPSGDVTIRVHREASRRDLMACDPGRPDNWQRHLTCKVPDGPLPALEGRLPDLARFPYDVPPARLAEHLARSGVSGGPALDTIRTIRLGLRELLAELRPSSGSQPDIAGLQLDPGLIDGAMRTAGTFLLPYEPEPNSTFLAFTMRRVMIGVPLKGPMQAHLRLVGDCEVNPNLEVLRFDLDIFDMEGRPTARFESVALKRHRLQARPVPAPVKEGERIFTLGWAPAPIPPVNCDCLAGTSVVLIAPSSTWRSRLEDAVIAAGASPVCLPPPRDPAHWPTLPLPVARPGCAEGPLIVQVTAIEDEIAGLVSELMTRNVKPRAVLVAASSAGAAAFARCASREAADLGLRVVEQYGGIGAEDVLAELKTSGAQGLIRYDSGARMRACLALRAPRQGTSIFRRGGVYWITGGAGAVGSAIAAQLAGRFGARVLLSGRREGIDPALLDQISRGGGEVLYHSCDVTDRAVVAQTRDWLLSRWGKLNGVIHAAGGIADVLTVQRKAAEAREISRAKCEGARIIAEITADDRLDVLAFCSTLVTLTGVPGQGDYAAANSALDTLAAELHAKGRPAVSVAMGPWAVGMAADPRYQATYQAMGLRPFAPTNGARLFVNSLSTDVPYLGLVDLDPESEDVLRATVEGGIPETILEQPARQSSALPASISPEGLPPETGVRSVLQLLRTIVSRHAHCDPAQIGVDTPVAALGIDSLMAVEIALELQNSFGVRVPPTLLMEVRTLRDLQDHLERLVGKGTPR